VLIQNKFVGRAEPIQILKTQRRLYNDPAGDADTDVEEIEEQFS